MDTFVVRLVLVVTVLAWGSVLVHDLATPDAPLESAFAPSSTRDADGDGADGLARPPTIVAPTGANASAPRPPR